MLDLSSVIKEAISYLGEEVFANLKIQYEQVDDKSELTIIKDNNKVVIKYGEKASLFRGLSIVKEKIHEDLYQVTYHKNFNHNGLMHDCSRNGVLTLQSVKNFILISALFGLNRIMLYTEDTYEIEGEPFFGYLRGKYTKEELKEIAAYGDAFGVEVVPCIQTLSHLNQALRWNAYADRRESHQTFVIGEEKTYQMIEKMIKTCKECFTSKNIHIGMDEAFDMGVGTYLIKGEAIDKTKSFLYHLNRVVEICHKYGLKPMMWEDMFFQLNTKQDSWYSQKGKLSDEIKALIPDVGLVYWDYNHKYVKEYDDKFKATLDTGKDTIYAGGAISWTGFAPNINASLNISKAGLTSAINNGVKSVFVTSWGDNGAECTVISSIPALALYSTFDFEGKCDKERLSTVLKTVTGDEFKIWSTLELPNKLRKELLPYENQSKPFFYQDPLVGLVDARVKEEYPKIFKKHARILKNSAKHSEKYGYAYQSLSDFCSVLEYKVTIGKHLRECYQNKDEQGLRKCLSDIKVILKRLAKFEESYRTQWLNENKPQGYDVIDGRIGYLKNRLKSAYLFVEDYLNKKIPSIPELEEKILPFDGHDYEIPTTVNLWAWIVSVHNM